MKKTPDNRQDLLDDLDNLHSLLGDESTEADNLPLLKADADSVMDEEQLPLLQPETPARPQQAPPRKSAKQATRRPRHTAPSTAEAPRKPDVKDALASRINPFLQHPKVQSAKRHAADANTDTSQQQRSRRTEATSDKQPATRFTDSEISHLVDDVINACLPHIEQTLRVHLTAALHRRNRRADDAS